MLYDKEARGYLPLDEFKTILREIDPELPEDELDEMIDEIDGKIEFFSSSSFIKFISITEITFGKSWFAWYIFKKIEFSSSHKFNSLSNKFDLFTKKNDKF